MQTMLVILDKDVLKASPIKSPHQIIGDSEGHRDPFPSYAVEGYF